MEYGGREEPKRGRSRRELPAHAVAVLKAWLVSPEHFQHPYPTAADQAQLMQETGIDKKQLKNWFTNARRRIWKPLVKHKLETGDPSIDPSILENAENNRALPPKKTTTDEDDASFALPRRPPPQVSQQLHAPRGGGVNAAPCPPPPSSSVAVPATTNTQRHNTSQQPRQSTSYLDLLKGAQEQPFADYAPRQPAAQARTQVRTVRVSRTTACHFCLKGRVDTQLEPCKHLFHGNCLRPWLEATVTQPTCPVCAANIANCVLADSSGLVAIDHQLQQDASKQFAHNNIMPPPHQRNLWLCG